MKEATDSPTKLNAEKVINVLVLTASCATLCGYSIGFLSWCVHLHWLLQQIALAKEEELLKVMNAKVRRMASACRQLFHHSNDNADVNDALQRHLQVAWAQSLTNRKSYTHTVTVVRKSPRDSLGLSIALQPPVQCDVGSNEQDLLPALMYLMDVRGDSPVLNVSPPLSPGDVLLAVNGQPVHSLKALSAIVSATKDVRITFAQAGRAPASIPNKYAIMLHVCIGRT